MPTTIDLARRISADGVLDLLDWEALRSDLRSRGLDEAGEKAEITSLLRDPDIAARLDPDARRAAHTFLGTVPVPAPAGAAIALGRNREGQPIFFKEGLFVADPNAARPHTALQIGDSLYAAASLIAGTNPATNVLAPLSLADRQALLARLQQAIAMARPDVDVPEGLENGLQAMQLRSCAATCLLELLRSLRTSVPEERLLQAQVLEAYVQMVEAESSSMLRESMVVQLYNNRDCLATEDQNATAARLLELFAPTKLPFDEWFANGNDNLNVVCHTGEEFFTSEVDRWKREGYEVQGDPTASKVLLRKTYEVNGVTTHVNLTMVRGASGTFDEMSNPDVHVVAYSGHANWGRTIPGELRRSPDEHGTKVVLIHQCCGRGIVNKFRDKYGRAQLITTRNSSTEPEDFNTFNQTILGIVHRRTWPQISAKIRDDGYFNRHDNYQFPSDVMLRLRARDRDHDGITDVVDRLVDFNTFKVAEDTAHEFQPQPAQHPASQLEGAKVFEAAQILNTTTTFSEYMERHAEGESFIATGFFSPSSPADPMVKITPADVGGCPSYEVSVRADHAHASEEAIKAEAFYTLAWTEPFKRPDDSPLDTCLKGLILVAHSLDVDSGYRDSEIFDALCAYHHLPQLNLWDVKACVRADSHVYAGSADSIEKLRQKLGPEGLASLEAALA